ncbi:MAG: excinuclease ABC subunit A [Albidovulum sp.]
MMNRRNLLLLSAALVAASVGGAALAKDKHCPPGLAKKSPSCVPPGHAKKRYRDDDDDDHHHHRYPERGDRIDRYDDYSWLRDYDRYGLPRLPRGQRYYVLGDRIYAVNQDTYEILNFVRAFSELLN